MKVIELDKQIVDYYNAVAIEKALRDLRGVVEISFIESTAQVFVYCDDDSIDTATLVACFDDALTECVTKDAIPDGPVEIEGVFTGVEGESTILEGITRVTVTGMHCGSCVTIVRDAIRGISGVNSVSVSLITGQAVISHSNVRSSSILNALTQRGYAAELISSPHDVLRRLRAENASNQSMWLQRWLVSGVGVGLLFALKQLQLSPAEHWWFAVFIATSVQVLVGGIYLKNAFKLALVGASNMDTLIAIGTTAAYLGGLVFQEAGTHLLMDAPMILAFVSFGKWIEVRARQTTVEEFAKVDVMNCETSHLLVGDETQDVPTSELVVNDRIIVRPGEVVPTDGKIVSGESAVNQSWLTGESTPRAVSGGDRVFGGSVNGTDLLTLEVDVAPADNRLHKMTQVLEKGLESQIPLQTLADSIVQRFVPGLLAIALVTLVAWMVIGHGAPEGYAQNAWKYAVSVLVVACPCALGLATPVALLVMSVRSVREGILFANPLVMEKLGAVTTLILDKTGTITASDISVKAFDLIDTRKTYAHGEVLAMIVAVEKQCNHPLALAIVAYGNRADVAAKSASDVKHVLGGGISGLVQGHQIAIGTKHFVEAQVGESFESCTITQKSNGSTYVGIDGEFAGIFEFDAKLLPGVKADIDRVKVDTSGSLEVMLATGDNQRIADDVAFRVGIEYVHAGLAPEDKVKLVREKQSTGNVVVMVGDGVNDAIALVAADVGIAVARGANLATEVADIVLLKPGLRGISRAIRLSNRTRNIILQNIFWAFLYNVTLIPIAAGCFVSVGIEIQPRMAAGAMACSSLIVVFNSLRLRVIAIA
ncbi:MAG: cation-translocating P-type ATPase [Planctomycetaceae bacterium]|nr:cation-translocating P-type ATPase [Planctomycetaceae bacterium]MBT5125483.1 cation-translocating P-type ATPase [Planctomycetaceae bacterium]MBT5599795.1 cation-translocating P-type ATPase [Planctomycetaceae bacterium]